MKETVYKSYYTFRGTWIDIYYGLVSIIDTTQSEKFSIWEPKDPKGSDGLIVLYNGTLPETFTTERNILPADPTMFEENFKDKRINFKIHGYNEYRNPLTKKRQST